jgi:transcriptional regulator with XRE-family HTH domain
MLSTGFQLAAARALVGMAQESLAKVVGLSTTTIRNMEGSRAKPIPGRSQSVQAVQRALEAAGVLFLADESAAGVGVRLRKDAS